MNSDTVLCEGCGITLRPFMNRCPRCGMSRPDAPPPLAPTANEPVTMAPVPAANRHEAPAPVPANAKDQRPDHPPAQAPDSLPFRANASQAMASTQQPPPSRPLSSNAATFSAPSNAIRPKEEPAGLHHPDSIFMSPPDEVRRFPLLNPGQWFLLLAALVLITLGFAVGYLIWAREKKDSSNVTLSPNVTAQTETGQTLPLPAPTLDILGASPTPELAPMLEGDQAIYLDVTKALSAYNPIYHSRYQVIVKDGVVTVTGSADNQPEKDGVTNVLKLVAGIRGIANNLSLKTDPNAMIAGLPVNGAAPPMPATTQNTVQSTVPAVTPAPENNLANQQAALEAERQRLAREADAQRQREIDFQRQRETETQQRQREEEQRRQREEAERQRTTAVQPENNAPQTTRTLRSGTVAWSGIVDGVDEIVIVGSSASVRHRSGEAVREARASFSASIPRAPVAVNLLNSTGRGAVQIIQEPSAANGYSTIVRIDDTREGGGKPYQFTLRWTAQ